MSLGAGCTSSQVAHVAEPFRAFPSQQVVAEKNGFGPLPAFSQPPSSAVITIEGSLPTVPEAVNVLRLRGGLPNETEWRNLTGSIGLPGSLLGDIPTPKSLTASWSDPSGMLWSYDAAAHRLEFAAPVANSSLTLQTLPASEDIIRIATSFFQTRALSFRDMRDPQLSPDWNAWWKREQGAGHCIDQEGIQLIREQAKKPLAFAGFPVLRERQASICGSPEFPTIQRVISAGAKDGLDVVQADGNPVILADLLVDVSRSRVISGSIRLLGDADRSDYATIDQATLEKNFLSGGLSGLSGVIRLTSFQQAYLQVGNLLIPVSVGTGKRQVGESEEIVRIVVPLVRP